MYGKEFEFFLQVCKDGSIRKAAKSLYISPQGLGKMLAKLEDDLGIRLFERGKDGIRLTAYGEAIKPFAQNIVDNAHAMHQSIGRLDKRLAGDLNVACSLGVVGALKPSLFHDFQVMYPEVTLNLVEGADLKVQDMVAARDDFVGISVGPFNRKGLDETFLTSNKLVWLVKKTNPLAAKATIEFSDLKGEPLIMYSEEFAVYHKVLSCCQKAGVDPNIVCYINEAIMAYKFCNKYNALALTVDFIAEDVTTDEIVIKPILDQECRWDLYFISKADQKPSALQKTFMEYLFKVTGKH